MAREGKPTKPVSDPRQCLKCGVIHTNTAWSAADGYHLGVHAKGPSGAAEVVGGTIGRPDDPTPRVAPPSPGNGPWLHLATGVHVQEGSSVVHVTSKERVTLEGLYPLPGDPGTRVALVKWADGSRSLIEPGKLRKMDPVERGRYVLIESVAYPINTSAEMATANQRGREVNLKGQRLFIYYADTGERVDGLFAWFTVE